MTDALSTETLTTSPTGSRPLVQVKHVRKAYGPISVLRDVSMTVTEGETAVVIGPSGGGKSTLLKCIHALADIDDGEIWVDGDLIGYTYKNGARVRLPNRQIARQRSHIGMVFQHFDLFPHRTVLQNIAEGPIFVQRKPKNESYEQARELLASVGLPEKANDYPSNLSGGQKQRVAIARALAMRPKVMLFDEPTSALDPELVGEVLDVMRKIAMEGMTSIVVTHEMTFARDVGDSLYFLADGHVIEHGAPAQVMQSPQHERTQRFLRSITEHVAE